MISPLIYALLYALTVVEIAIFVAVYGFYELVHGSKHRLVAVWLLLWLGVPAFAWLLTPFAVEAMLTARTQVAVSMAVGGRESTMRRQTR